MTTKIMRNVTMVCPFEDGHIFVVGFTVNPDDAPLIVEEFSTFDKAFSGWYDMPAEEYIMPNVDVIERSIGDFTYKGGLYDDDVEVLIEWAKTKVRSLQKGGD